MPVSFGDIVRVAVPALKSAAFAVVIDGEDNPVKAGFNKCDGIGGNLVTATVDEPGDRVRRLYPYRSENQPVTLVRGMDIDGFLFNWYRDARDWQPGLPDYRRGVSIYQLERVSENAAVARRGWFLYGAFPLSWNGPSFNSMSSAISFESVTLHYDDIQATPLLGAGLLNTRIGG